MKSLNLSNIKRKFAIGRPRPEDVRSMHQTPPSAADVKSALRTDLTPLPDIRITSQEISLLDADSAIDDFALYHSRGAAEGLPGGLQETYTSVGSAHRDSRRRHDGATVWWLKDSPGAAQTENRQVLGSAEAVSPCSVQSSWTESPIPFLISEAANLILFGEHEQAPIDNGLHLRFASSPTMPTTDPSYVVHDLSEFSDEEDETLKMSFQSSYGDNDVSICDAASSATGSDVYIGAVSASASEHAEGGILASCCCDIENCYAFSAIADTTVTSNVVSEPIYVHLILTAASIPLIKSWNAWTTALPKEVSIAPSTAAMEAQKYDEGCSMCFSCELGGGVGGLRPLRIMKYKKTKDSPKQSSWHRFISCYKRNLPRILPKLMLFEKVAKEDLVREQSEI